MLRGRELFFLFFKILPLTLKCLSLCTNKVNWHRQINRQIVHSSQVQLVTVTFGVHVQAVGLAAVVGGHVVVADGDVEGVAPCNVVTQ